MCLPSTQRSVVLSVVPPNSSGIAGNNTPQETVTTNWCAQSRQLGSFERCCDAVGIITPLQILIWRDICVNLGQVVFETKCWRTTGGVLYKLFRSIVFRL